MPFYPPNSPKNPNFEKIKTTPRDIIILHTCTKNYDQMMYGSWDMVRDRCNSYFSFWAIFCPFIPLTAQKVKILRKWKKTPGDIIILRMCIKNYDQMMYSSWDMLWDRRTDEWMDGWMNRQMDGQMEKWHIEVGAPPKNIKYIELKHIIRKKYTLNKWSEKLIFHFVWLTLVLILKSLHLLGFYVSLSSKFPLKPKGSWNV